MQLFGVRLHCGHADGQLKVWSLRSRYLTRPAIIYQGMSALCDENGSHRNIFGSYANVVFIIGCPLETKAFAIIISVIRAVPVVALALLLIWRVLATIQASCTEDGRT